MKTIEAEITGVASLLQHRFAQEAHGLEAKKAKKKVYDPDEEAKKASYMDEGGFVMLSEHIYGCLAKAATSFILDGKKTFKDAVARGIVVTPDNIPLLDKKEKQYQKWDEIDARRAVVMRSAITRWRPMFYEGWKLRFEIQIVDDDTISPKVLKEIFDKAGYVGIGDYRPRFGRFQVTGWKENGKA